MRQTILFVLVLGAPVCPSAVAFESVRLNAGAIFLNAVGSPNDSARRQGFPEPAPPGDVFEPLEEIVEDASFKEATEEEIAGFPSYQEVVIEPAPVSMRPMAPTPVPIARMDRGKQLNRHRPLLKMKLGSKYYLVSVAVDAAFDNYYISFMTEDKQSIQYFPVRTPKDLIKSGIVATLKDGTQYNFKVSINIFDPWRGSTLRIKPYGRTKGKGYALKLGTMLDLIEKRAFVFRVGGREFWTLYGTDVDPATRAPGQTQSLLFFHFDGLDSKAWPLAESILQAAKPVHLDLGGVAVTVSFNDQGEMVVYR